MFEYFLVTIHFWILSKKRKIHFWIREAEFGFYQRNKFALFSSRKLPFCNFFSRGRLKIARSAFRKIYKLQVAGICIFRAVFTVYKGPRDQPMPNEVTKGDQNQNSPCNTNAF